MYHLECSGDGLAEVELDKLLCMLLKPCTAQFDLFPLAWARSPSRGTATSRSLVAHVRLV
jgi:hypothetical protein